MQTLLEPVEIRAVEPYNDDTFRKCTYAATPAEQPEGWVAFVLLGS